MRVYRLRHKQYKGDVVFGLPFPYNQLDGEKRINKLFSKMKPWKHCIPYYKNSKFAFVSLSAINTFLLYNKVDLTPQEFKDINDNFIIESFEISVYSSGFSKFLCNYLDEDVVDMTYKKYKLKDISSLTFDFIKQPPVPQEDIKMSRLTYYNKIKTYYNND